MVKTRKDVSIIVIDDGITAYVWRRLAEAVSERGGTAEHIHSLASDETLIGNIADLIVGRNINLQRVFRLKIDYNLSLGAMINRGSYNWVHPDITEAHFPIEGEGKKTVTLELVHFAKPMTSDKVEKEFKASGLTPGKIEHFLALGAKYPDLQRQFPIIASGAFWRFPPDHRLAPVLWGDPSGRRLSLGWAEDGWDAGFRFLALRES